ncbi:lipopolysaccharide assembly protein LapA domain-containing protein [Solibacillus sp. FSL W7-1464]|uniref:LapA family protein n=1 Tax=Solibacillus sp. FSL W7-1464 TaxID=2921706 RepID=UPI0030F746A1
MKIQWTLVVGLIFAIIIAVFATVNVDSVQVNYVFGEARWPLILVILGSVLIGFIISFCFSAFRMYGGKRQTKAVRKELEAARVLINEKDAEVVRLKNELRERGASAFVTEEVPDDDAGTAEKI